MRRLRLAWLVAPLLALAGAGQALAETGTETGAAAATQQIVRAGSQSAYMAPSEYFTGRVRIEPLWPANQEITAAGNMVTFEPGAHTVWHTHPKGQRLVVVSGLGLTQEWGKPVQVIRPGDVVWCPPGIKHWHGAAPASAMTHLSVAGSTADGQTVTWMEAVSDDHGEALTNASPIWTARAHGLLPRQAAIAPITAAAALGDMPRLHLALEQGLDAGLSISDIKEILVQLYAYAGFPRSLNALTEFMGVLEARSQRGIHDAPGRDPGPVPTGAQLLATGTANQTKLVGAPVTGPLFNFAPAAGLYLKTHLFGDIFARDNLDWPNRELATLGVLAALSGVEVQLDAHLRYSLNIGLTPDQLNQWADALARQGLPDAADRARASIKRLITKAASWAPR